MKFDSNWRLTVGDKWTATIDDIYSAVGIIPGLKEDDVKEIWESIDKENEDFCTYHEACLAFVFHSDCNDEFYYVQKYVEWKDDWFPGVVDADTNNDGYIDIDELREVIREGEIHIHEILAVFDTDGDGKVSYEEATTTGWLEHTRKE